MLAEARQMREVSEAVLFFVGDFAQRMCRYDVAEVFEISVNSEHD
jgi:hypothetical protein